MAPEAASQACWASCLSANLRKPAFVAIFSLSKRHYCQRQRLGSALLKDAMLRTVTIADNAGVRGLLVHAISEDAKRFYLKYGFQESPMESMTLLLSVKNIKNHF